MAIRKVLYILLGLAFALFLIVQIRAGSREAAIEAAFPPEGQFIAAGPNLDIHYVTMGAGPDIVLIHGASGSTRDMTFGLARALAENYTVWVFDRPGLGYSDRTDPAYRSVWTTAAESPGQQAWILHEAARTLGVERPLVLGHSLGGAVALAWALNYPEDTAGLILVAGVSNPWPGKLDILYRINGTVPGGALLPPLAAAFVSDAYVGNVTESIFAPQPAPAGYAAYVGPQLVLRRATMRANGRQVAGLRPHVVEMTPRYGDITTPTEIVHGDADTIVPLAVHSAKLVDQIPDAVLTVLPGQGHMPHHTATEDVIAAVDRAAARAGLR